MFVGQSRQVGVILRKLQWLRNLCRLLGASAGEKTLAFDADLRSMTQE